MRPVGFLVHSLTSSVLRTVSSLVELCLWMSTVGSFNATKNPFFFPDAIVQIQPHPHTKHSILLVKNCNWLHSRGCSLLGIQSGWCPLMTLVVVAHTGTFSRTECLLILGGNKLFPVSTVCDAQLACTLTSRHTWSYIPPTHSSSCMGCSNMRFPGYLPSTVTPHCVRPICLN